MGGRLVVLLLLGTKLVQRRSILSAVVSFGVAQDSGLRGGPSITQRSAMIFSTKAPDAMSQPRAFS